MQNADAVLWERLRSGSQVALGEIFDEHVQALHSYGKLFTRDEQLIEDCVQDLFVTLWEKRKSLGAVISLKHYLFSCLRRLLLRRLRAQRKLVGEPGDFDNADWNAEYSYESWLLEQQRNDEVRAALKVVMEELTPQQKKVLYLKFYEHLTYEEVASTLNVNLRTVYNITSLALGKLHTSIRATPRLLEILSIAISIVLGLVFFG